jgi:hypothetical protein
MKPGAKKLVIVRLPNDKTRASPIPDASYIRFAGVELILGEADADTAGQQDASDAEG